MFCTSKKTKIENISPSLYRCVEMLCSLNPRQRCLTVVGFWVDRFQAQVFSEQSHGGVLSVRWPLTSSNIWPVLVREHAGINTETWHNSSKAWNTRVSCFNVLTWAQIRLQLEPGKAALIDGAPSLRHQMLKSGLVYVRPLQANSGSCVDWKLAKARSWGGIYRTEIYTTCLFPSCLQVLSPQEDR